MSTKGHIIKNVKPGSIAEEMGLEAGDRILKINNNDIEDIFDYQYFVENEYIEVLISAKDGEECLLEIEKDMDEDLGVEFENGLMDDYKSCCNKCIFCFIDQMPKGMRETLYFKDDDSRLSFLQGNYVTLTNMKEKDIDRIIKYNLGPINVSVHTTNPELRKKMLHNRFAGEALKKIDTLYEGGVEMNGQIVLCKGINDGDELRRSIEDLSKYIPVMRSVSVVPSGLTKYREGLYPLELFKKEDAREVIAIIEEYQKKIYKEHGIHFIQASDEWYIMAEYDFPEEERYDGYIQLENGVGMMRLMRTEFDERYNELSELKCKHDIIISMATGVLAYDELSEYARLLEEKIQGLKINCYKIINNFFGENITVSGLITGTDLIDQLKSKELGVRLILPGNILRSGEDVFLDDYTLDDVKKALNEDIVIAPSSGDGLIDMILGILYNEGALKVSGKDKVKGFFGKFKGKSRKNEDEFYDINNSEDEFFDKNISDDDFLEENIGDDKYFDENDREDNGNFVYIDAYKNGGKNE